MTLADRYSETSSAGLTRVFNVALASLREAVVPRRVAKPVASAKPAPIPTFELIARDAVGDRDILVLDDRSGFISDRAPVIGRVARSVAFATSTEATLEAIAGRKGNDDLLLVIDIDSFDSASRAVTCLSEFRRRKPAIPVVIASRDFARNDFSTERAAIADASLRLPCTSVSLALGVGAAVANNGLRSGRR